MTFEQGEFPFNDPRRTPLNIHQKKLQLYLKQHPETFLRFCEIAIHQIHSWGKTNDTSGETNGLAIFAEMRSKGFEPPGNDLATGFVRAFHAKHPEYAKNIKVKRSQQFDA